MEKTMEIVPILLSMNFQNNDEWSILMSEWLF